MRLANRKGRLVDDHTGKQRPAEVQKSLHLGKQTEKKTPIKRSWLWRKEGREPTKRATQKRETVLLPRKVYSSDAVPPRPHVT